MTSYRLDRNSIQQEYPGSWVNGQWHHWFATLRTGQHSQTHKRTRTASHTRKDTAKKIHLSARMHRLTRVHLQGDHYRICRRLIIIRRFRRDLRLATWQPRTRADQQPHSAADDCTVWVIGLLVAVFVYLMHGQLMKSWRSVSPPASSNALTTTGRNRRSARRKSGFQPTTL